jgi:uncharacterized membrane protein
VNIPERAAKPGTDVPLQPGRTPRTRAQRIQFAIVVGLVVAYAAASHYGESSPDAKGLGAALSIGPVALIGVVLVWRWTRPLIAVLTALLLAAVLYRYWAPIERHFEWADLVEQCGAYGLIAVSFVRSLFGNRVPLCTQMAAALHGDLAAIELDYLRRATAAWAVFYGVMTAAVLILFFASSQRVWSLFVNFATFALIVLMGLADHALRRRLLPRHGDGGILGVLRRSFTG